MMDIIWSATATHDLEAIIDYIASDNLQAALRMDELLRDAANSLASFPQKGKPGRVPGTREFIAHEHYILVYVVTQHDIQIVTLLHAPRQWPPHQSTHDT